MMRTHVCRVTKRDVSHESDFEFFISENGKELFLGDPSLADDPTLKGLWDTEFGIEKLRSLASSPLYEGIQGVFQLYERMAFSVGLRCGKVYGWPKGVWMENRFRP